MIGAHTVRVAVGITAGECSQRERMEDERHEEGHRYGKTQKLNASQ